jgi:hypothetical protein
MVKTEKWLLHRLLAVWRNASYVGAILLSRLSE